MPSKEDLEFGKAAVSLKLVTAEQLDEAFEAQKVMAGVGITKTVGEVMVDKGVLSSAQAEQLATALKKKKTPSIGQRLVAAKLLTPEQLKEAAHAQEVMKGVGIERKLEEVVVEKGYATQEQVAQALEAPEPAPPPPAETEAPSPAAAKAPRKAEAPQPAAAPKPKAAPAARSAASKPGKPSPREEKRETKGSKARLEKGKGRMDRKRSRQRRLRRQKSSGMRVVFGVLCAILIVVGLVVFYIYYQPQKEGSESQESAQATDDKVAKAPAKETAPKKTASATKPKGPTRPDPSLTGPVVPVERLETKGKWRLCYFAFVNKTIFDVRIGRVSIDLYNSGGSRVATGTDCYHEEGFKIDGDKPGGQAVTASTPLEVSPRAFRRLIGVVDAEGVRNVAYAEVKAVTMGGEPFKGSSKK